MTARVTRLFTAAARAAFASIPLGPAISGDSERPGLQLGCTDAAGYLQECGDEVPRWFMADRVSQGVTVAQQIDSEETPSPIYPLAQWEVDGESGRDGAGDVPSVRVTYRAVSLVDSHVWIPAELVEAPEASGLRWFTPAELLAEDAHVAGLDGFAGGGYRTVTAAELDTLILRRAWNERRELVSYREGPVLGEEGQFLAYYETVRSIDFWS